MEGRAALAAVVAAALHGGGQLVGPAEGADEQRHQNGHQGPGPAQQGAAFKVGAPGLLGGDDLVRLLDEGGDEAQGDGHHHSQLVDGETELFQGPQQALQGVGEADGAGGVGQEEGAGDQHDDAQHHGHGGADALRRDVAAQPGGAKGGAGGEKEIHHGGEQHDDVHRPQAPGQRAQRHPGKGHRHGQGQEHDAVGQGAGGVEQGHDVQHHAHQLDAGVQPVQKGVAGEELAQGDILQHTPPPFSASRRRARASTV